MNDEIKQEAEPTEVAEAPETPAQEGAPDAEGSGGGDAGAEAAVVEIDGHKFKSEKEALSWALANKEKLENDRLVAEAYRTGIQDSLAVMPTGAPAPPPEEDEGFEEKFYADPKKALAERDKRIEDRIINKIHTTQDQRDNAKKVWEDFCALHPDLADFRTDVDLIASSPQHAPVIAAKMRTEGDAAAMNYVAQKTRAKFQSYNEKAKASTVLPRGSGAGPTPSGGQKNIIQTKKTDKQISMSDQVRQLRSKHR